MSMSTAPLECGQSTHYDALKRHRKMLEWGLGAIMCGRKALQGHNI